MTENRTYQMHYFHYGGRGSMHVALSYDSYSLPDLTLKISSIYVI